MLLAIDAGNSTINVGLFGEEKKLLFLASLETDRRKTRDQFCVDLMNLFALYHYELQDVQGAILCRGVVYMEPLACPFETLDAVLEGALTRLLGRRPVVVGPGAVTGLPMRVTLEYQVGADIIADAVGALEKFRPPIIVIDMGTATTIGVISEGRNYEGGMLLPGVNVSLEALSRREADMTRYLPLFESAVVVCREVSGGIVPMDGEERAWRERHGTLMQELARRADHVTRVFCGLTEVLK